jgi:hypothetical protein
MKTKNRLRGIIACFIVLLFGVIFSLFGVILRATSLNEMGLLLMMFAAGYGLRDSLEGEIEEE